MSQCPQYPPPSPQQPMYSGYVPPPQSPEELLAPARRAGTLMIVLGVLAVAFGLLAAYQANHFDVSAAGTPDLQRKLQQQIDQFEQLGLPFRTLMLIFAALPLAAGAIIGGLGFFVRGGALGWVITAIIVGGGLILIVGFMLLAGLIQGAMMGGPVMIVGAACFYGIPFVLLVVLMIWLIQAARGAGRLAAMRQAYYAGAWQAQQNQEAYRQAPPAGAPPPSAPAGMGYGTPPGLRDEPAQKAEDKHDGTSTPE